MPTAKRSLTGKGRGRGFAGAGKGTGKGTGTGVATGSPLIAHAIMARRPRSHRRSGTPREFLPEGTSLSVRVRRQNGVSNA